MNRRSEAIRERRIGLRHKVFQPTTLVAGITAVRAHLLNLSRHGALVHADAPPARGVAVRLECAGRMRLARVMWVQGARFGVAFALALSGEQVAAAIGAPPGGQAAALSMPSSPSLR